MTSFAWGGRRFSGRNSDQANRLAHGAVGPARVIAFGASNVAPAGAVVAGLVIVVAYAGFASPLVVLIAFVASLCCASSIAEFARRLPSAGSLYTYNSRGLGHTGGFLTGWMMVFAYTLYVPAGIAQTSAYASDLMADTLHVTIPGWVLFIVILAAVALVAYLGIGTSSWVDLVLVTGEVAVIAALAVTILVKVGPAHYSAAVLAPRSSPHGQLTDITNAMIFGITAFAGFEAAAALGEEARDTRRSIPAGTIASLSWRASSIWSWSWPRCSASDGAASPSLSGSGTRWATSPASTGRPRRSGPLSSSSCSPASGSSSPRST
jgi:amino acid transporter